MPASPAPSDEPSDEPDQPDPPGGPDGLAAEQAHLDRARAELARMRAAALAALDSPMATTDWVAAQIMQWELQERAEALTDDGRSALFFGRLDVRDDATDLAGAPRSPWYIGRRHVTTADADPVVLDWRAPVSARFYRASRAEPMGVWRRRRFGVEGGVVNAIEDEPLGPPPGADDSEVVADATRPAGTSTILAAEIERPRIGPMRDIVATIQPDQDLLIREADTTTLCIQGAPGTGKTAVGLHRAAWLLYAFRERFARSGVLVIGPNRAFLDHIGQVLPALGEVRVEHTTIDDLVTAGRWKVRARDTAEVATLKGDARMAQVLRRAVWSHVGDPSEALVVPRGVRRWRVPAGEVAEALAAIRDRPGGPRYDAARQLVPQRLAHRVLVRMEADGQSPDDRVQDAVARMPVVTGYARSLWPALTAPQVLHALWSDGPALAAAAAGILSPDEQAMLLWDKASASPGTARWSAADAVLLDEIGDLLTRTGSLGHVVLDEAQDLSAMQLRAVGRRCATGSATVLGDLAQGTTPWASRSWDDALIHLGTPHARVTELVEGFRVPRAVIEYAAQLLPVIAPGLAAPRSVRAHPGDLAVVQVTADRLAASVAEQVGRWLADETTPGSIGVIAPDALIGSVGAALGRAGIAFGVLGADHGDIAHRVDLVPATVAKGLEFDSVLVAEPAAIVAAEPDEPTGLRRLYVVLTRAVSRLVVLHAEGMPAGLAPSPTR